MIHCFKKTIALALALCSVLALCVPASAADYPFPEYGEVTELGVVLRGNPNLPGQVEIGEKNGRQYLAVPIKGKEFYVFALTDYFEGKKNSQGNYIYAKMDSGITTPRGIAQDAKGNFYVVGDAGNVFYYNLYTGASGKISTDASVIFAVAVDEEDNVYIAAKSDGASIYRVDIQTKTAQRIYTSADFTQAQSIACGGGKIFFQGPLMKAAGTGAQVRMLSADGEHLASYNMPGSGGSYYMSYVDGVAFCGADAKSTDGLVALDTAGNKLTKISIGLNDPMLGFATKPHNGKSYIVVSGKGIYEYKIAARKLGKKVATASSRAMRTRNYVRNGDDVLLLSVGPSSITTTAGPAGSAVNLSGLMEGAYSTFNRHCIAPGVPGTGVAVYVGAFLSSSVGSYSPGALSPITFPAFSNGHAQTDSMIAYKDKIYAGCYSGAYVVEYDPRTGYVRELIPGLQDKYGQRRIHCLAAGDDKIFFATIPDDQKLGGAIGWYDLSNDTWYCQNNVVKDQSVVTLAYDEARDILYCGTTVRGGTNTTPTAKEAVVMAYDVNAKKVLGTATVSGITGDYPDNISGIAQDPSSGKIWGLVSHTIFSVNYENGKLNITKEWAAPTVPSDPYTNSGGMNWFPKAILFDGRGHMYLSLNQSKYGIMRFSLGSDGKIQQAGTLVQACSRVYTLGADGNLYYYEDQLYCISLADRVATVKTLIDNADGKEGVSEARWAYDSLSLAEKERLGNSYYNKLLILEGGSGIEEQPTIPETLPETLPTPPDTETVPETAPDPDKDVAIISVKMRIDAIGKVTAGSGASIRNARAAYEALTPEQQTYVTNIQVLLNAEAAFEALADSAPTDQTDDNSALTVIIVIVIVVVLAAAAAVTLLILKKKKVIVEDDTPKASL